MIEHDSFEWMLFSPFKLFMESFDSPVNFSKNTRQDTEEIVQTGYFIIDDIRFNYRIDFQKEDKELMFSFNQEKEDDFSMKDENNLIKSQVLSVFSTIKEIISPWIDKSDYIMLEPTTEKKFQVYLAMIKKFVHGFEIIPNSKRKEIELFRMKKLTESREERIVKEAKKRFTNW
jgi:hypothetical protein